MKDNHTIKDNTTSDEQGVKMYERETNQMPATLKNKS